MKTKDTRGLCGLRVCRRLCVRVEHCEAGQARVKNLWANRKITRFHPIQLKLPYSTNDLFTTTPNQYKLNSELR